MDKIISFFMYAIWILTIIAILATTFTNFQYIDLNAIAVVSMIFALINSFFLLKKRGGHSSSGSP